jgi:hypothetical protein
MEGRASINDPLDHFSEAPACRDGVLPDEASGQSPGILAKKLSKWLNTNAKNVTGLLILLSLLGGRSYYLNYGK